MRLNVLAEAYANKYEQSSPAHSLNTLRDRKKVSNASFLINSII